MTDLPVKGDQPFDRLTHLCEYMTTALQDALEVEAEENRDNPEANTSEVRTIVFLEDDKGAGIQTFGYDDAISAMASLFVHMKAVFQAEGKDLDFVAIPDSPEGADRG